MCQAAQEEIARLRQQVEQTEEAWRSDGDKHVREKQEELEVRLSYFVRCTFSADDTTYIGRQRPPCRGPRAEGQDHRDARREDL